MKQNFFFIKLFMLTAMALFARNVMADEAVFDFDTNANTLFGIEGSSSGSGATYVADGEFNEDKSVTVDGVTLTVKASASDAQTRNRIWKTTPKLRLYTESFVVAVPEGKEISNISFTGLSWNSDKKAMNFKVTPSVGSLNVSKVSSDRSATWEGASNSITFTVSSNTQIGKMVVTFADAATIEKTEEPTITVEETDDDVIVTAFGDGMVFLFADEVEVENPYVISRTSEDQVINFSATAQEDGKEISDKATIAVTVSKIHEHNFVVTETTDPTCTESGSITKVCECGETLTEEYEPLGHDFSDQVITDPTCTDAGTIEYHCIRCGEQKPETETIPALGHDFSDEEIIEPTCTDAGAIVYHCTRCGEQKPETEIIPAFGHDFGSDGVCTRCGEIKPSAGGNSSVYDFAAAASAGENPDNLNGGNANGAVFYGWENEGKTYSKRQDYKGYTNYTGTNLPEECHVWRRSDRINGNIGDGGLKCPSQKEMAINGLSAGSKVVIEYTGSGEILYATGYDPANPTAEPNTVAVVGDGNKAAISGATTIASGTPIHIVSTDNGYFVFRVLKGMVITKITISEETPIDPSTVVMPNKVTVADGITNGTVKVSQAQACAGDEVSVTATPSEGFKLESITVTGVTSNEAVTVTDGKFTMIADDVTVSATFTDSRIIYDFAAAASAGENPDNLNGGNANGAVFYGWENEGKTYSKRQDYKGYTNYTGTNLPEECHVWRRSDRINGNIGDGGLKCPSQKEMAINGLSAGSKVVIEYTGSGEMLYATGYDPANPTAEPNTVAVVGDGNKAAISGATTIASGTPIHIVSTDNGYFVFRVLKGMVITKITISEETPIDPATVVMPNKVTVADGITNGTVKAGQVQACAGDEVTVTATPDDGFKLEAITVTGVTSNESVAVTDGKFTMIADDVTVSATFVDTRIVYDFAAAAAAGENPENLNGSTANGAVFYGWEKEDKTYSKRQDYRGYQNYTGTNLPAECHVWRRSDRINNNVADGGLKCPSQKEMAINGLSAGSKVVIEYTGDGEILYATGYDPANPTAEPNTVAVVGDGNKAAISGATTIASGAPIHIVSTDNGYFVFRVLKGMVITKITISEETPIDPATVVMPNKVTVADGITNGTVKAGQVQACAGDEVTVTATPDEGYELESLTVKDGADAEVTVSEDNTFTMPATDVTVTATFKKLPEGDATALLAEITEASKLLRRHREYYDENNTESPDDAGKALVDAIRDAESVAESASSQKKIEQALADLIEAEEGYTDALMEYELAESEEILAGADPEEDELAAEIKRLCDLQDIVRADESNQPKNIWNYAKLIDDAQVAYLQSAINELLPEARAMDDDAAQKAVEKADKALEGVISESLFDALKALREALGIEPTGIRGVEAERSEAPAYNLAGQRVNANTAKGIIIRNGRKYVK